MKKLMITASLLCGLLSVGYSQDAREKQNKTPKERAQRTTDAMEKKLNLTADQKSKVYEINLDRAKKMNDLRTADKADRTRRMDKQKKLMDDGDQKLNKILNADQQKSYQESKIQMKERAKKHYEGQKRKDL